MNELDQPIWAVASQTTVYAVECTHAEACRELEAVKAIADSGLAIITDAAAKRQLALQKEDRNASGTDQQ